MLPLIVGRNPESYFGALSSAVPLQIKVLIVTVIASELNVWNNARLNQWNRTF